MAEILTKCADCGVEISVPLHLFEIREKYRCLLHTLDMIEKGARNAMESKNR